jgi:hypothetical protein
MFLRIAARQLVLVTLLIGMPGLASVLLVSHLAAKRVMTDTLRGDGDDRVSVRSREPDSNSLFAPIPLDPSLEVARRWGINVPWNSVVMAKGRENRTYTINGVLDIKQFHAPYMDVPPDAAAAWARDTKALVITADVAAANEWHTGQDVVLATTFGPVPGTIVGIASSYIDKVVIHADYLDTFMPPHLRRTLAYVHFPCPRVPETRKRLAEDLTTTYAKYGVAVWAEQTPEFHHYALDLAPQRRAAEWLSRLFLASLPFGVAALVLAVGPSRRWLLLSFGLCLVGTLIGAAFIPIFYPDGVEMGQWCLEEVVIRLHDGAMGVALTGGASLVGLLLAMGYRRLVGERQRPARVVAWVGVTLTAAATFVVIGAYDSMRGFAALPPGSTMVLLDGWEDNAAAKTPPAELRWPAGVVHAPERVTTHSYHDAAGIVRTIRVRGLDETGAKLLGVSLPPTFWSRNDHTGVFVGPMLVDRLEDFHEGDTILVGKEHWPIRGILPVSRRSPYASEIWCDREALAAALVRDLPSTATLVSLPDEAARAALRAQLSDPFRLGSGLELSQAVLSVYPKAAWTALGWLTAILFLWLWFALVRGGLSGRVLFGLVGTSLLAGAIPAAFLLRGCVVIIGSPWTALALDPSAGLLWATVPAALAALAAMWLARSARGAATPI